LGSVYGENIYIANTKNIGAGGSNAGKKKIKINKN